MNNTILKTIGIFLVSISVFFELCREVIDFEKGFFSISIGLSFILVSLIISNDKKKSKYILLTSFFIVWLVQRVSFSILNIEISVDEFILFFLLVSITTIYVSQKLFKRN